MKHMRINRSTGVREEVRRIWIVAKPIDLGRDDRSFTIRGRGYGYGWSDGSGEGWGLGDGFCFKNGEGCGFGWS